ncbi:MAG: hypothetical protein E7371_00980 [Clostridiales bacterium]|nr:hypothetical protein [Clostridiales bacterium]
MDFFIKRRWFALFSALLFTMIFGFSVYAYTLSHAKCIWVGKTFYFLVSADTHIQSATHEAQLSGGAGYLLTDGDSQYTAYSVYLTQDIAYAVQADMQEETLVVEKRVEYMIFHGKEKSKYRLYQGAFNALYGCMDILTQNISRLENGETQDSCKRILQILERQIEYMANKYHVQYPAFALVCKSLGEGVGMIAEKVVYCKDLRYLLCVACEEYLRLASAFTL